MKGPQREAQKRLDRRLEEVAEAVGGGYCRLQMPLRLALGVRGTVAGHRLAWRGGSNLSDASLGGAHPPTPPIPGGGVRNHKRVCVPQIGLQPPAPLISSTNSFRRANFLMWLLSVTNAIKPGTCRRGDSCWA